MSTDRIEKKLLLKAPRSRVWRAISDSKEFSHWFGVKFDEPFVPGKAMHGTVVGTAVDEEIFKAQQQHAGLRFECVIDRMEPERLFSFTWAHPKSFEKSDCPPDYSNEPTTLVEFRLEKTPTGTLLVVTESGFDKLPADRRLEAFRRNEGGWAEQMRNIEKYVANQA